MERLQKAAGLSLRRVIGINSGTSADGLDIALMEVRGHGWSSKLRCFRFRSVAYPDPLRRRLRTFLSSAASGSAFRAEDWLAVDHLLGEAMGRAALSMKRWAEGSGRPSHLVASHGQTVWHGPRALGSRSATLQLGNPSRISVIAGLPVVADFRQADVAAGGEGAPLTPALDYLLFRNAPDDTVTLNLGGIANISAVRARGAPGDVLGFDVGPCNLLLDGLAASLLNAARDDRGRAALRGRPSRGVAERLLEDPFFRTPPPRSTGRERFGGAFLRDFARRAAAAGGPDDVLATAVHFVAASVAEALSRFVLGTYSPRRVIAAGGGLRNLALRRELRRRLQGLGLDLEPFRAAGLTPDSKEAGLFAWLGSEAVCGEKAHLPQATGAGSAVRLGVLVP
jgi:anhydro-N-acetylmuramic acid kinase